MIWWKNICSHLRRTVKYGFSIASHLKTNVALRSSIFPSAYSIILYHQRQNMFLYTIMWCWCIISPSHFDIFPWHWRKNLYRTFLHFRINHYVISSFTASIFCSDPFTPSDLSVSAQKPVIFINQPQTLIKTSKTENFV